MITEIRNKITTVGETVTGNFFYQVSPKSQSYPYCVYSFFGNELIKTTKSEGEHFYFQVACHQRTDALAEALASSIETAFLAADMGTTNYNFIELRKLRRVPFALESENKGKQVIVEFYLWMESK